MKEVIDRELAEKERGLLEQDYATPCPNCGGVVFEWWDSETCRDCEESTQETSTEQATLITDGGRVEDDLERDTVSVEREVLRELVETCKGKLETDVSRWGEDGTGYDVDEFAEIIEKAERSLNAAIDHSEGGDEA